MTRIKWLAPLTLLALVGCTATAGVGRLGGLVSAAQSGGALTPITNIGNAITLQELANSHNTIYEAQQILNSIGPVTVAAPPAVVVMPSPPPIVPIPGPVPPPFGPIPTGPTPNG